jgi:hypothetical protein
VSAEPIGDDEIAHLVVVLRRTGAGIVPLAVHVPDEMVAHDVATVFAKFGPTWLVPLYGRDMNSKRYRAGCPDCEVER